MSPRNNESSREGPYKIQRFTEASKTSLDGSRSTLSKYKSDKTKPKVSPFLRKFNASRIDQQNSEPNVAQIMVASTIHIEKLSKAFSGFKEKVNEWRSEDVAKEDEAVHRCIMKHKHIPMVYID